LAEKIEKTPYRPPDSEKDGPPFGQILERAGVKQALLAPGLAGELERWRKLRDVLLESQEAIREGKSVQGLPLILHKTMFTELRRHLAAVDRIARRWGGPKRPLEDYEAAVFELIVEHSVAIRAFRNEDAWKKLLDETRLPFEPHDPEVSVRVAVFHLLRRKLQDAKSRRLGISDQFLRALTELTLGRHPAGDSLRQAVIKRSRPVARKRNPSKNRN
jgi:hypothetical protein